MMKLIVIFLFLTTSLIVGCTSRNVNINKSNDKVIIHYIGDESVFEN